MRGVSFVVLLSILQLTVVHAAPKATKEEVNLLSTRLERIERTVDAQAKDNSSQSNKQGLINLQNQLKTMERELQNLRSENEQLRNEVEQMQARQREMFLAIDKRLETQTLTNVEPSPAVEEQQVVAEPVSVSTATDTTVDTVQEPVVATTRPVFDPDEAKDSEETTEAYRQAFLLLKQREYEDAITSFDSFLQSYPKSKYSANAQYWMAEANYVTKKYEDALQQFQIVIEQYPTSSKVPDARLKIGYTYYELGRWEEARVTLTRLRAQFPNSTVAGLAQQRLERLENEGH